jgi:hypothetical protein
VNLPSQTIATPIAENILHVESYEVFEREEEYSSELNKIFNQFTLYQVKQRVSTLKNLLSFAHCYQLKQELNSVKKSNLAQPSQSHTDSQLSSPGKV